MEKHASRRQFIEGLIGYILLRRTKDQLDSDGNPLVKLPKKTEKLHVVKLGQLERLQYDKISREMRNSVYGYFAGKTARHDSESRHLQTMSHVFVKLIRLQQTCSHLSLLNNVLPIDEVKDDGLEAPKDIESLTKMLGEMTVGEKITKMLELLEDLKTQNEAVKW
ncbi:Transcription termination factor 2 [Thelohanellus kitauei]|uniref:Transcription termination factor 2 n=1 Tax=Thelohanellus kitauei TaxID=669202 RepID=A0A0C2ILU2_THEKT|nr:Transcription termination factor 2 [Thelohanellus kitauei]